MLVLFDKKTLKRFCTILIAFTFPYDDVLPEDDDVGTILDPAASMSSMPRPQG